MSRDMLGWEGENRERLPRPAQSMDCRLCEAFAAEYADGSLPGEEEAAPREHAEACSRCRAMLRDAESGRMWMRLLHAAPPPVPEALLGKILLKTAAARENGLPIAGVLAGPPPGARAPLWMTAAMAMLSTALTLSLAGIHLAEVSAAVRSPASVESAASRQFFDAKKQVVSSYDNSWRVREMEAAVNNLRRAGERGVRSGLRPSVFRVSASAAAHAQVFPPRADERKSL